MENISVQDIWKQNEALLEKSRVMNLNLLTEIKLDKVKSSLRNLLFLPISSMVFYIITTNYAIYFSIINKEIWYLMFSGAVIAFFSILLVISSIKQLSRILSVDYNSSIMEMQKKLVEIKLSILSNLRIAAYLIALSPFVGIFFTKVLFNIDLVANINSEMIIPIAIITVLLEIISLLLLRALRHNNINKKWLNWLLVGSGSQVDEAIGFLNEIREFEKEIE